MKDRGKIIHSSLSHQIHCVLLNSILFFFFYRVCRNTFEKNKFTIHDDLRTRTYSKYHFTTIPFAAKNKNNIQKPSPFELLSHYCQASFFIFCREIPHYSLRYVTNREIEKKREDIPYFFLLFFYRDKKRYKK